MTEELELHVNGRRELVRVDPTTPLLQVLRNDLGLTAAKYGCGLEQCFACAVLVDDEATTSCATPVDSFVGRRIVTLEGLAADGELDPVQQAFLEEEAAQCGYCIPGMIIGAVALLARESAPTEAQIRTALDPHLCRCGTHPRILKAVRRAAGQRA